MAATTSDENSTGGGVGLTTGGTGAAPTVKMQQSRQDAPAVTPATVTAAAAPAMTTASAAATAVAAAAAATAAASPTASGANGSGGNNNGVGNSSPTTAAQTVAAINKKRKKEGLKPIITTDNPATGSTLSCSRLMLDPGSGLCVAAHPGSCPAVRWFRSMGDVNRAQVAFWFMIAARKRPISNLLSGWRIGGIGGDGKEDGLRWTRAKLSRARIWPGEHCGRKRSFAGTEDGGIPNKDHLSPRNLAPRL
ncbi:hypothetical protein KVR01_009156 [Diaporthe batatas]|uniref:uncharacterized protein n=1 Tax=Diaporthe batatas TaxID=748121 RepID=UPI001D04A79E|nr:uncharacterized protein KVR01_009156 [Diaporthe batatas]KAG8160892.1 hypothetical protein KVR01_009156 [Diaporthe batatas]